MTAAKITHAPERYCRSCWQSLRGVISRKCPECGRDFDPNDPRTTSPHPHGCGANAVIEASHVLIVGCGLAAVFTFFGSATGFVYEPFLGPLLLWMCGGPLVVMLIPLIGVVFWRSFPLSRRMRVMGIVFPLLYLSIALTNWPLRLNVAMHRPFLNKLADRVQVNGTMKDTGFVGMFRYRQVRLLPNGNVGLQLSGDDGGGVYLARPANTGAPGPRVWYGTNWEVNAGGGWYLVYED